MLVEIVRASLSAARAEAEARELETLRRRDRYGRHREMGHVVREFGDAYLRQMERLGVSPTMAVRQERVLHSWGQRGNGHVHVHILSPAGGLTHGPERLWVPFPDPDRFLSLEMLGSEFRDRLLKPLDWIHAFGAFEPTGRWSFLASYAAFDQWLSPLREIAWVVRHRHVWRPEGVETGRPSEKVVKYLARYANRVMIANSRLHRIENGEVYCWYKDYRDNNTLKMAHLPGVTFLATFLQHILPPGIHNKRRYGFWGYSVRSENLTRIRAQLEVPPVVYAYRENNDNGKAEEMEEGALRPRHCATCKEEMEHVGGTPRPSPRTVGEMVCEDMTTALDVVPESYRVRTWDDVYMDDYRAEQAECGARQQAEDKANRRRGPPPDRQGRVAFMAP